MRLTTLLVGVVSATPLIDLFEQLDARLPNGDYRIPSLVATPKGTLLAFVMGRMHRTEDTPNIVYIRRSFDDGASWTEAVAMLNDPSNRTRFGGAPVVCPRTGAVTFVLCTTRGFADDSPGQPLSLEIWPSSPRD